MCLTERQWDFIRPFLPPPARTGPPRADNRRTIEGLRCMLIWDSWELEHPTVIVNWQDAIAYDA